MSARRRPRLGACQDDTSTTTRQDDTSTTTHRGDTSTTTRRDEASQLVRRDDTSTTTRQDEASQLVRRDDTSTTTHRGDTSTTTRQDEASATTRQDDTLDVAVQSRSMTMTEAVIDAIATELRRDARVFYLGQDVGPMGGSMQGTHGLFEEFGARRVRETPISESAMVGAAIGAALFGQRPIVEISFGEFVPAAMNQLINQAPNLRYMTGGVATVPLVVRTRVGDGPYGGHPHDYSAWFAHVPGWKVVMPSRPADARGLMLAAIRDDNPVLFFEPMSLAHASREPVPTDDTTVPIGQARLARPGADMTVAAIGSMVPASLRAAEVLASDGIDIEVVDLRSVRPLDTRCVVESVGRTGRLLTVHESWVTGGLGAEVVAAVATSCPQALRVPAMRLGTAAVPTPSGKVRPHALPNTERIVDAVRALMAQTP